jgi:hypothetical protein
MSFNGMDYKPAQPRNTAKLGKTPSRTPGKAKGDRCQTDPTKKYFATSPKAYTHPQYEVWNAKFRDMNMARVKM